MDTSVSSLQRLYMVLQRVCAALIPRSVARNTAVEPSYGGALAPQRPCASICRVWAALYKDSSKYTGHLEGNLAWAEIEISCFFSVLACCYGLYFAAALLQITYTRLWPWISSLMCLLLQGYHRILAQRLYFYLGSVAPAIVCRVITLCICSLKHRYDHIYPEITVLSGVYIHALSIFTGEERWGWSSRSYTIFFSSHAPRTSSFLLCTWEIIWWLNAGIL